MAKKRKDKVIEHLIDDISTFKQEMMEDKALIKELKKEKRKKKKKE